MKLIWEHNGNDTLLFSQNYPGAYTRGTDLSCAVAKMPGELRSYAAWSGIPLSTDYEFEIVQEKESDLNICDADSDVLFNTEALPLSMEEYRNLKALVLRSAADFHKLYAAIPDKQQSASPPRKTFYGDVPRTAQEMYDHTRQVNSYYFGEIGICADNEGTIYECRERGFARLEENGDFLQNSVIMGSYDELWSVGKLLRRFLWHDRIHAKAMYRMAVKTVDPSIIPDPFLFHLL